MMHKLLPKLALAVAANEATQRKFRTVVLIELAKIEATLTQIQGCQLAKFWDVGGISDEQRTKHLEEVEEQISSKTIQLSVRLAEYIYEDKKAVILPQDRRRKWSGWEI